MNDVMEKYYKAVEEDNRLQHSLIGAISGLYGIPLAEIHELEKRIKEDEKLKEMNEADAQEAARKKFHKLMNRFKVIG